MGDRGWGDRRWPWLVAAVLLGGAAVAAGWATYAYWLPCRGTMLLGTVLEPFGSGREFSDACLRRMDDGTPWLHDVGVPLPEVETPSVIAWVLGSLAWLVLTLGQRWSARTTLVAALVSVSGLAAATVGASSLWILAAPNLAAVVAVLAIMAWQPEVRGRSLVQVLVALSGATALGLLPQTAEYMVVSAWSSANWDVPPGTGILTAVGLAASAVTTVMLTRRPAPHPSSARTVSIVSAPSADLSSR